MPTSLRTVLAAPSQATTYFAVTVSAAAQVQADVIVREVELEQFVVADLGDLAGALAQQRLHRRLLEHHARRPAERPGRGRAPRRLISWPSAP
jgi:hypothetical protein